jgi:hypothetical protein
VTGRVSITLAGYAVGTGQRSPDKGRHAGRGADTHEVCAYVTFFAR